MATPASLVSKLLATCVLVTSMVRVKQTSSLSTSSMNSMSTNYQLKAAATLTPCQSLSQIPD